MQNTIAKDIARKLFYQFVAKSFNSKELSNARAVVLLGKEVREIPYLDKLGINRHRVTCIENDMEIYKHLRFWNKQQGPGKSVELFRYELNDYLRFLLDREQEVEIFNLDVCGTLQNNILPQFTNVIKLSQSQSKTVIATYFSAGRDQHVLLKSLEPTIWLMMFDPMFKIVIEQLVLKFVAVGHSKPVAFNHAFRVMQWLYSMIKVFLEVSHPKRTGIMSLDHIPDKFWREVLFSKRPFTWSQLCRASEKYHVSSKIKKLILDCPPVELQFVAYRGSHGFTQIGHFMKLEQKPMPLQNVISTIVEGLQNFHYANDTRKVKVINAAVSVGNLSTTSLMSKPLLRKFKTNIRKQLKTAVLTAKKPSKELQDKSVLRPQKTDAVLKEVPPHKLWNSRQSFTDAGRTLIRTLAHRGEKARQIASYFPEETPFPSISAMVAIANRPRNRPGN